MRLQNECTNISKKLESYPKGKLTVAKNRGRTKWYCSYEHNRTYIPKGEVEFAKKLAEKLFLEEKLKNCQNEIAALKSYLEIHQELDVREFLDKDGRYRELLKVQADNFVEEWLSSEYDKCTKYPERLIHKSISGNILRSKSEVLIDMALYRHQIPYHYEEKLILGNIELYPDFTLLHPTEKRKMYWEHLGMMDDEHYARNACLKIEQYIRNNIIPQRDLILTFETKDNPLDCGLIEKIIEYYLE